MFGWLSVLCINLKLSSNVAISLKTYLNADELIEENQICRKKLMERVKANFTVAQAWQKEQYTKKHHDKKPGCKWITSRLVHTELWNLWVRTHTRLRAHDIYLKPYYSSAKTVSSSVVVSLQPHYIYPLKHLATWICFARFIYGKANK